MATYHDPVLLAESVSGLNVKESGTYIDATFGGGGHSREILARLGPNGRLIAFDRDEEALGNDLDDRRFSLVHGNFRYIGQYLKFYGIRKIDGVLADFGVSSHQFDSAERGFSTRFDGELDMRMDQGEELSANQVINGYDQDDLARVLYRYGDLKQARAMAEAIIAAREADPIKTTGQLAKAVDRFLPKGRQNKVLAQVFQGIRIEVNQEVPAIEEFLMQLPGLMDPGARLSAISYHSLEDRLVKRFIRAGRFQGEPEKDFYGHVNVPFQKVGSLIVPTGEEIARNGRARSAKLRIAERIGQ